MEIERVSEQSLSECDNAHLSYDQAMTCSSCGSLPRMVPVFRDSGITRFHRGYVVQCVFCEHGVVFVSATREEALAHWNKLQGLEQ